MTLPSSQSDADIDSVVFHRAKDAPENFAALRTLATLWNASFDDSGYTPGSGGYFYTIRTITGKLTSALSAPAEIYCGGPPAKREK